MILRENYLNRLLSFKDKDLVKVVTGVHRCGKSTLLDMARARLQSDGIPQDRLFTFKMEFSLLSKLPTSRPTRFTASPSTRRSLFATFWRGTEGATEGA